MSRRTSRRISSLAWHACAACTIWLLSCVFPLHAQSCTMQIASTVDLGTVDPASANPTDSVVPATLSCTSRWEYVRACVNLGLVSGSWTMRTMKQGTYTLNYNFYQDAARSYLWTSTQDPANKTAIWDQYNSGGTLVRNPSIYVRIFGGQNPKPGVYTSTFSTNEGSIQVADFSSAAGPPACTSSSPPVSSRFSFTVTVNVGSSCSVSAANIDFGQRGIINAPVNATGLITTTCGSGTNYSLALSAGTGVGATMNDRRMTRSGGSETLVYRLYRDSGRTQSWGDGSGGSTTVSGTGTGAAQTSTVYATLPPQSAAVGSYADTITVTVTF